MKVLVINCGSSSLKFQLINTESEAVACRKVSARELPLMAAVSSIRKRGVIKVRTEAPMPTHTEAIALVLDALTNPETGVIKDMSEIDAVGHRIVHGGGTVCFINTFDR